MRIYYDISEPGSPLDNDLKREIVRLFRREYFHYHYMDHLTDINRLKCVAYVDGEVVGFAGASVHWDTAILSNLLVARPAREMGIGKSLEMLRYDWVQGRRYTVLVMALLKQNLIVVIFGS
jgi:GNAT superfamily N-acetyltransferase